jgi:hypothetical protein
MIIAYRAGDGDPGSGCQEAGYGEFWIILGWIFNLFAISWLKLPSGYDSQFAMDRWPIYTWFTY